MSKRLDQDDAPMSLGDRIFPAGRVRDGHILRLDLVSSWESQLIGLGRLTAFLSPRLLRQSHAVDDMGLYVVFLQRHRVEVGLKLILERAAVPVLATHEILTLFNTCGAACDDAGFAEEWATFARTQKEYVELINEVDPGAATFRYPVDTRSRAWSRKEFVDLAELESTGEDFEAAVFVLTRHLAALEPIPVAGNETEETVRELVDLVRACRGVVQFQRRAMSAFQAEIRWLGVTKPRSQDRNADAYAAAAAVEEVTAALAKRAQEMVDRIWEERAVKLPDAPVEAPLPELPRLNPLSGARAMKAQQDAQIEWFVDGFVERVRPLMEAVDAVKQRSAHWSSPAARQVHLDVTRFRSRLMNAQNVEDGGSSRESLEP